MWQIIKLCLMNRTICLNKYDNVFNSLMLINKSTRHMMIHYFIDINYVFPISMVRRWHGGIPGIKCAHCCNNDNIRSMTIDNVYKKEYEIISIIEVYTLPKNLRELDFDLPPNYPKIKFNSVYDTRMFNFLTHFIFPDTLTHLTIYLENNYCISTGVLPRYLTHLFVYGQYDSPIKSNVLPVSLICLAFGDEYNQPLGKNVLPPNLIYLYFGYCFNQPLGEDVLPKTLQQLRLSNKYRKDFVEPNNYLVVEYRD